MYRALLADPKQHAYMRTGCCGEINERVHSATRRASAVVYAQAKGLNWRLVLAFPRHCLVPVHISSLENRPSPPCSRSGFLCYFLLRGHGEWQVQLHTAVARWRKTPLYFFRHTKKLLPEV